MTIRLDEDTELAQRDRIRRVTLATPTYKAADWDATPDNAHRMLARLLEEAGEISGAVKSYFGRPLRPEVQRGDIHAVQQEIGDCLVIIYRLCDMFQIAPSVAIDWALNKYENRLLELKRNRNESDD